MATDQPALTALLIVDPDGWLHEVPRHLFTKWCEVKGIARPDNLLRALSEHATERRRAAFNSQTRQSTSGASGSHCTSSCFCRRWTSISTRSQRALTPATPTPAAMSRVSWRAERHLSARIEGIAGAPRRAADRADPGACCDRRGVSHRARRALPASARPILPFGNRSSHAQTAA